MKVIPPEVLLYAYAQGVFPMAESKHDEEVDWYTASRRGIIPLDGFHISKNVQRIIRQDKFEIRVDTNFRKVVQECANRESSWINDLITDSFELLHKQNNAHSVEVYQQGKLVGGLYGVSLGAAFFGESMFKKENEADKVALYYCHQILKDNGFRLWDTQFYTDHLAQFGCIEIEASEYETRLAKALEKEVFFIFGKKT